MSYLTSQEIDLIQDGLDSLEIKNHQANLMNEVVGSVILHGHNEEVEKRFKEEMDRRRLEVETSQRVLRDRIVLLKAKLIHMRDSRTVEAMIDASGKQE